MCGGARPLDLSLERLVHEHEATRHERQPAAEPAHQNAREIFAVDEARVTVLQRDESEKVLSPKQEICAPVASPAELPFRFTSHELREYVVLARFRG